MAIYTLLAINVVCILACHYIAKSRGAKTVFWGVMGAVFGPLAVPFALFSKPAEVDTDVKVLPRQ